MKKILITGSSGIISEAVFNLFLKENEYSLVALSSHADDLSLNPSISLFKTDILESRNIKEICYREKPDIIINTSSISHPELCVKDKMFTQGMNVSAVDNLVKISKILDCHFIQISTDRIFDGVKGPYTEQNLPNPINYYGKTKLNAENSIKSNLLKYSILRTSLTFGFSTTGKKDFVSDIIANSDSKSESNLSTKIYQSCSYADDIALAILKVIKKTKFGIYHLSGSEVFNHFEIGKLIAKVFGSDEKLIIPNDSTAYPDIKYPEKCGFINLKAETDLNMKFSNFENALTSLKFHLNESKLNYYRKY